MSRLDQTCVLLTLLSVIHASYFGKEYGMNCTDECRMCLFETCLECDPGYYGKYCKPCPVTCLNNECYASDGCSYGCEPGWYGEGCFQPCKPCPDNECDRYTGACIEKCSPGECSPGCDHTCDSSDDDEYFEEEEPLYKQVLIPMGFVALFVLLTCCCVLINRRSKPKPPHIPTLPDVKDNAIEIVPSSQRLLPGTVADNFSSSNRSYPHSSLSNMYLDVSNTMTDWSPVSNSPAASSYVTQADIPPPPRAETPPPSYSSIFKTTDDTNVPT